MTERLTMDYYDRKSGKLSVIREIGEKYPFGGWIKAQVRIQTCSTRDKQRRKAFKQQFVALAE